MQDLHWAGLLNPNGILALHDYTPRLRSVKWAADYFLANNRNREGTVARMAVASCSVACRTE